MVMLKSILISGLFIICGQIFSQCCPKCNAILFADDFLHLPRKTTNLRVFHYIVVKYYKPDGDAKKRTEDYRYLHNGDDLKGAESIFSGDLQGAGWLKNFDFGKFASAIIEVSSDRQGRPGGAFQWHGKLLFFNLFNKRRT